MKPIRKDFEVVTWKDNIAANEACIAILKQDKGKVEDLLTKKDELLVQALSFIPKIENLLKNLTNDLEKVRQENKAMLPQPQPASTSDPESDPESQPKSQPKTQPSSSAMLVKDIDDLNVQFNERAIELRRLVHLLAGMNNHTVELSKKLTNIHDSTSKVMAAFSEVLETITKCKDLSLP